MAFNEPRLIEEQIRLLRAHLEDPFELTILDNSNDPDASRAIDSICEREQVSYWRPGGDDNFMHHSALNAAAERLRELDAELFGFLDHDVFPMRPTRLVPLIEEAGFLGIGQRTPTSGKLYLWPGFCFFSRVWVGKRSLNFGGADGGDTGSALWPLFVEEDWERFYRLEHQYRPIRRPDDIGLQSWGIEILGDWGHLTNGSKWMAVPNPEERECLLYEFLESL